MVMMKTHRARPNHKSAVRCVETGKVYKSIKEAAIDISGNPTGISAMLTGHLKSYKGLHFEYVNIFKL
jgi:putative heme iron utilization protein